MSVLTALKKFKEGLYRRINSWLYTDKRIIYFLDVGTNSHAAPEEDGTVLDYECIESFDDEELVMIESQEKDSTKEEILGITAVYSEKEIYILYSMKTIKDYVFSMNPLIVWSEIMDIAKHEAFHVRQYRYLLKHGGMKAVKRVKEYMATTPYEDNMIEIGAYAYQIYNEEQDFSAEFDRFIYPEKYEAKVS